MLRAVSPLAVIVLAVAAPLAQAQAPGVAAENDLTYTKAGETELKMPGPFNVNVTTAPVAGSGPALFTLNDANDALPTKVE